MTVLLLLFLARSLSASPRWTACRRFVAERWSLRALSRPLLLVVIVAASGCAPSYRYLSVLPAHPPVPYADRPAAVPSVSDALAGCSAGQPVGPSVQFSCLGAQEIHVLRVEVEDADGACGRYLSHLYGEEDPAPLALPLPAGAAAVQKHFIERGQQGVVSAACSPRPERGALVVLSLGAVADRALYARAIPALAYDAVPETLVGPRQPDSLDFFGRPLPIHPSCEMKGVRNVSCYPAGQMDWAEYRDVAAARSALEVRVQASLAAGADVLDDKEVDCLFEGAGARCRRVTYRLPIPWLLRGGASDRLVTFYAAEEVRGHSALAVCSYFDDQGSTDVLAALCAEAFALPGQKGAP